MRPLEAVLGCIIVLGGMAWLNDRFWRVALALSLVSLALILVHSLVEGPRLQAAPLYVGALCSVFVAAWHHVYWPFRVGAFLAICGCSAAGLLACYIYPVFRLPPPDGPYAIGTSIFYLSDPSRRESFPQHSG